MTSIAPAFPRRFPAIALALAVLQTVTGCVHVPTARERAAEMDHLARHAGWNTLRLPSPHFVLTAYAAPQVASTHDPLTVYIEGDGMAWQTATLAADDPTPIKPVALQMALRHPKGPVAYLARPCQNVQAANWRACGQAYWTSHRYAPEVIASMNDAISQLKEQLNAHQLVLVGYSGGGAVAALVAARRRDVERLVTVAANLDTQAWTQWHHVTPLSGSLNPADAWADLLPIEQRHFVGEKDTVVPRAIVESFVRRFPAAARPALQVVPEADHQCCWARLWPELARSALP